jgi:hypothetical protein
MKGMRSFLLLLVAVAALAQNPQPPASVDANSQKARALLDQMIVALGGQAYLNYQDMYQEGRTHRFYEGRPAGVGGPFFRYWRWPEKERTEYYKQHDWIVIYVGDQGYDTTFRGTRLVDPEELTAYLQRRDHSLEVVLRTWLNQPGTALFYEGAALVEQKPAEKISIINSKNDSVTIYIDTYAHLPIKTTHLVRDPVSRERDEEGELFDHYKLVQGIMTPYNIVRLRNGEMTRQLFMDKVQYNMGASDALFTPPPLHYDRTKK